MTSLKMTARIELQVALEPAPGLPENEVFSGWVNAALESSGREVPAAACVTIRMVSSDESNALNAGYRDVDKATNVLAFPAAVPVLPEHSEVEPELGDLVICHEVVTREAQEQGKTETAHLAHLVVHGTLHLLGYDHQDDDQANEMEALETGIMQTLGFADPYEQDIRD